MRLGFIALLSRDWLIAIGDSLSPDCTARACFVPLLFMSILAQRLHPVVVASVDCLSSTSEVTPTIDEHDTNMDGYVTNLLEHLSNLNETGISPDEHVTNLVSRWSSIPRAWHYLCRKRDNGNVHRAAAKIIVSKSRAAHGSVCNVLLSRYSATEHPSTLAENLQNQFL